MLVQLLSHDIEPSAKIENTRSLLIVLIFVNRVQAPGCQMADLVHYGTQGFPVLLGDFFLPPLRFVPMVTTRMYFEMVFLNGDIYF